MTLWIIAAVAVTILLGGIAFLTRKQEAPPRPKRIAQPWDERPGDTGGTRLATMPPPAGLPIQHSASEEADRYALESQELWIEEDEPTGPVAKILVSAAGKTDPGKKREHNEDALLLAPEHELYAIADGMGGYAAGEVASQLAVDTLRDAFRAGSFGELDEGFPKRGAELMAAIRAANADIRREAQQDESRSGMGTTIVAARFSPGRNRVYVAHVGDSRCYRIRDGELKQLTTDHTLGAIGITGPSANKLSRAVGAFDHVDVDLTVDEPQPGDHYLLCSDGLYKMLLDERIAAIVAASGSLAQAVDELIDSAIERGGRDNITVVLLRVDEPELDPRESGEHRIPG